MIILPVRFNPLTMFIIPIKENNEDAMTITKIKVNSTIQKPSNMDILNTGKHLIQGIASRTGKGLIKKVEVSTDNGHTWSNGKIDYTDNASYEWASWSYEWNIAEKRRIYDNVESNGFRWSNSTKDAFFGIEKAMVIML